MALVSERRSNGAPTRSVRCTTTGVRRGAVDAFIADQPDPEPSWPEAGRILTRDCLIGAAYLPDEG
jgi:hypothetical protein